MAPGLTAAEVRVVVHALVEEAIAPLQRVLLEAQHRIIELERRVAATPPGASTGTVVLTAAAPVAQVGHASAIAAPARPPAVPVLVRPAPLLDVEAILREVPMDLDMRRFDGRRRRRRMVVLFVFGLLVVFGALLGLLAYSYTPHHETQLDPSSSFARRPA
jgi:hypothetical protein